MLGGAHRPGRALPMSSSDEQVRDESHCAALRSRPRRVHRASPDLLASARGSIGGVACRAGLTVPDLPSPCLAQTSRSGTSPIVQPAGPGTNLKSGSFLDATAGYEQTVDRLSTCTRAGAAAHLDMTTIRTSCRQEIR